ncbi:hypothetical protein [Streptomyces bacillaris]|uniref:hypothetical protein n=1 Tax=Streptomyces bacillaris TaxID=68179 RepID=UPI00296E8CFB
MAAAKRSPRNPLDVGPGAIFAFRTSPLQLTWEQLLAETPFERWTPSPPFPPAAFRRAAVRRVHQACRELRDLGPKPRKPAARKVPESMKKAAAP